MRMKACSLSQVTMRKNDGVWVGGMGMEEKVEDDEQDDAGNGNRAAVPAPLNGLNGGDDRDDEEAAAVVVPPPPSAASFPLGKKYGGEIGGKDNGGDEDEDDDASFLRDQMMMKREKENSSLNWKLERNGRSGTGCARENGKMAGPGATSSTEAGGGEGGQQKRHHPYQTRYRDERERERSYEDDDDDEDESKGKGGGCCHAIQQSQFQHFSRGTTWLSIALGQVLSLLLCVSGVTNVYLVERHNIRIPTAQNFGFYIILATVFTTILACRPADRNLFPILRTRGWKYALVALVDAEAKYLVCKAYQLTTLTSVQLLDCFAIPTVLSLSWLVLRIRYKVPHIIGVSVSLLGICCVVWADVEEGKPLGPGKNRFLGDMLCLSGAFLHGISNVAQEFVVKTFDAVEFLGMIGLFGSFVSGTQTVMLEYGAVTSTDWAGASTTPIALIATYTVCQTATYLISVLVMKWSSATFFNLSLLSADFYSLIVGIYLFHFKCHSLYFVSFGLVMLGVIIFSMKPTIIASHIYKSLTREHTTTLDLELMASTPTPGVGCNGNGNLSSVNYVLRDPTGQSILDTDDESFGGGSILVVEKKKGAALLVTNGGSICPSSLSIQNCDVVMQTSPCSRNHTCSSTCS